MNQVFPSRAELAAAYGAVLDRWAAHQRSAHRTDEHACCPVCLDLVEQIDRLTT